MNIVALGRRVLARREATLAVLILIIVLVMSQATPHFLSMANFRAMAIGLAPTAIIAIGMTILLVSGGFDLSVGSVLALCSTAVALMIAGGVPIALSVLCALLLGAVIGLANGLIVTRLGVNPLVATLGTMSVARGVALVLTEGFSVSNLPSAFGDQRRLIVAVEVRMITHRLLHANEVDVEAPQSVVHVRDVDLAELLKRLEVQLPFKLEGKLTFQVKAAVPLRDMPTL